MWESQVLNTTTIFTICGVKNKQDDKNATSPNAIRNSIVYIYVLCTTTTMYLYIYIYIYKYIVVVTVKLNNEKVCQHTDRHKAKYEQLYP